VRRDCRWVVLGVQDIMLTSSGVTSRTQFLKHLHDRETAACVAFWLPSQLSEAYEWLMKYKASRKEAELHQVKGPGVQRSRGRNGPRREARASELHSAPLPSAPLRRLRSWCPPHRGAVATDLFSPGVPLRFSS
jgi:hypothetical protein